MMLWPIVVDLVSPSARQAQDTPPTLFVLSLPKDDPLHSVRPEPVEG
jgi:hypothetical protein